MKITRKNLKRDLFVSLSLIICVSGVGCTSDDSSVGVNPLSPVQQVAEEIEISQNTKEILQQRDANLLAENSIDGFDQVPTISSYAKNKDMNESPESVLKRANRHFQKSRFADAQRLYVKYLQNDPATIGSQNLAFVYNQLGVIEHKKGNFSLAENYFYQANADVIQRNPEYLFHYAKLLYDMERVEEAKSLFEEARQLDPNNKEAEKYLVRIILDRQSPSQALEELSPLVGPIQARALLAKKSYEGGNLEMAQRLESEMRQMAQEQNVYSPELKRPLFDNRTFSEQTANNISSEALAPVSGTIEAANSQNLREPSVDNDFLESVSSSQYSGGKTPAIDENNTIETNSQVSQNNAIGMDSPIVDQSMSVSESLPLQENALSTLSVESNVAESNVAESNVAESDVVESDVVESDVVESDVVESDVAESDVAESNVVESWPDQEYLVYAPQELFAVVLVSRTVWETKVLPCYAKLQPIKTPPQESSVSESALMADTTNAQASPLLQAAQPSLSSKTSFPTLENSLLNEVATQPQTLSPTPLNSELSNAATQVDPAETFPAPSEPITSSEPIALDTTSSELATPDSTSPKLPESELATLSESVQELTLADLTMDFVNGTSHDDPMQTTDPAKNHDSANTLPATIPIQSDAISTEPTAATIPSTNTVQAPQATRPLTPTPQATQIPQTLPQFPQPTAQGLQPAHNASQTLQSLQASQNTPSQQTFQESQATVQINSMNSFSNPGLQAGNVETAQSAFPRQESIAMMAPAENSAFVQEKEEINSSTDPDSTTIQQAFSSENMVEDWNDFAFANSQAVAPQQASEAYVLANTNPAFASSANPRSTGIGTSTSVPTPTPSQNTIPNMESPLASSPTSSHLAANPNQHPTAQPQNQPFPQGNFAQSNRSARSIDEILANAPQLNELPQPISSYDEPSAIDEQFITTKSRKVRSSTNTSIQNALNCGAEVTELTPDEYKHSLSKAAREVLERKQEYERQQKSTQAGPARSTQGGAALPAADPAMASSTTGEKTSFLSKINPFKTSESH